MDIQYTSRPQDTILGCSDFHDFVEIGHVFHEKSRNTIKYIAHLVLRYYIIKTCCMKNVVHLVIRYYIVKQCFIEVRRSTHLLCTSMYSSVSSTISS